MQRLMGLVRRCVDDYDMISAGDKIAVGVSGGKDSLVLLVLLAGCETILMQNLLTLFLVVGHHRAEVDVVEFVLLRAMNGILLATLPVVCATRSAAAIVRVLRRESHVISQV